MRITEENCISQIQYGNEEAIAFLLQHYGWILKTVSKKHLYNSPDYIEDCMNDILFAIWNNIHKYSAEKGSFKNWIAAVSKFTALNYVRKLEKHNHMENIDDLALIDERTPETVLVQETLDNECLKILDTLSKVDQDIFIKLYIEQYSIKEVSEQLGKDTSVIYNRISRAKKKLKDLILNRR